jgi:hypothetical protein
MRQVVSATLAFVAFTSQGVVAEDAADVAARIRASEDSLASLAIDTSEFPTDQAGDDLADSEPIRYQYVFTAEGRRSVEITTTGPDGQMTLERYREDGSNRYKIEPFPWDDSSIGTVRISVQPDGPDEFTGTMCLVLWLIMPGGKSIARHLDDGALLTIEDGPPGQRSGLLTSEHNEMPLRITLSEAHDWLARRVELGEHMTIEATDFLRTDGRWFPSTGTWHLDIPDTGTRPGRGEHRRFEVQAVRLNRPVSPETFSMPKVQEGTLIIDRRQGRNLGRIEGGEEVRRELIEQYMEPSSDPEPLVARPRRRPLALASWGIGICGIGLIAVAVALRLRRA